MHYTHVLALSALVGLYGCGPRCPAANAIRDDLLATVTTDGLTLNLRATRLAQANDSPAALFVTWSGPVEESVQLTLLDADGVVLAHPSATGERQDGFNVIRLQNTRGSALPPGLYGISVTSGAKTATARFEIVHCTVYY
jgi:hypothetical protein